MPIESIPMRQFGGRASVVVRGRESRPHGEGGQINLNVTANGRQSFFLPFTVEQPKGSKLEGSNER